MTFYPILRSRNSGRVIVICLLYCMVLGFSVALATGPIINAQEWSEHFVHSYDYVLRETEGLARDREPVEVTLTMAGDSPESWRSHIRILRLVDSQSGELIPHEVLGSVSAGGTEQPDGNTPHPATSINIVFLADCPAKGTVTYRIFWGRPSDYNGDPIPEAPLKNGMAVSGDAPGLVLENNNYTIELSPKSGAIARIKTKFHADDKTLFYHNLPIHFGTDIWSPGQSWDHDYDWPAPPNQRVEGGPLALRYHRWGPLHTYTDVEVSITYTFYAGVPYVHVSSTMRLTHDRSVHAIRMGEIVVSHTRRPPENPDTSQKESPEVFTHYGWPDRDGHVETREINAYRNELGQASVPGLVPGGLGVLDRDTPWVAGYNLGDGFGLATLRKHQFVGNYLGNETPQSAPCTYLGQYGWGFVYWSRPMVYPLGALGSPLDLNTAVAAGSIFGTEEALLVFSPDEELTTVQEESRRFTAPLRFEFKGTGPW